MSAISKIKSRAFSDLINEGLAIPSTGVTGGSQTDYVVLEGASDRVPLLCGFSVTTSDTSAIAVSIGFKNGISATRNIWSGLISLSSPIVRQYPGENWYWGELGDKVVLTCNENVTFTLDIRLTTSLV